MTHQYTIDQTQYEAYGKLVVSWVQDPSTAPQDLAAFRQIIKTLQGDIHPGVKDFRLIVGTTDTIILRLPPKELVNQMLTQLENKKIGYTLPEFYQKHAFVNAVPKVKDDDSEGKKALYHCRIADYSLGQCG